MDRPPDGDELRTMARVPAVCGEGEVKPEMMHLRTVMVSGKFDPPHDGHIDYIIQASALGDWLYVVVQPDEGVRKVKDGNLNMPLWARMALLKGILRLYNIPGQVVEGYDRDGRSVQSLLKLKPNVFAKGGDRDAAHMPSDELRLCEEQNIEVSYGLGDKRNSSSEMRITS